MPKWDHTTTLLIRNFRIEVLKVIPKHSQVILQLGNSRLIGLLQNSRVNSKSQNIGAREECPTSLVFYAKKKGMARFLGLLLLLMNLVLLGGK